MRRSLWTERERGESAPAKRITRERKKKRSPTALRHCDIYPNTVKIPTTYLGYWDEFNCISYLTQRR